jgi:hypothetical protein
LPGMCSPDSRDQTRSKELSANGRFSASATFVPPPRQHRSRRGSSAGKSGRARLPTWNDVTSPRPAAAERSPACALCTGLSVTPDGDTRPRSLASWEPEECRDAPDPPPAQGQGDAPQKMCLTVGGAPGVAARDVARAPSHAASHVEHFGARRELHLRQPGAEMSTRGSLGSKRKSNGAAAAVWRSARLRIHLAKVEEPVNHVLLRLLVALLLVPQIAVVSHVPAKRMTISVGI